MARGDGGGSSHFAGVGEALSDLNPFAGDDDSDKPAEWNGEGKPPTREAAVRWLTKNTDLSTAEARKVVGSSGTLTTVGKRARDEFEKQEQKRIASDPVAAAEAALADGEVSAEEAGSIEAAISAGPEASGETTDAPLWRYSGSPEQLEGILVPDASNGRSVKPRDRRMIEARYRESHTLMPIKWAPERRADLQRTFHSLGLYGEDAKVRTGSWSKTDQAMFAEVLASANEEGLRWWEVLAKWKREGVPEDVLNGGAGGSREERAPLVVRHTDRRDLEQTATQVSREMIGRVDRDFANSVAPAYNAIETQTQTAAYNAAEDGGTVTDAPSASAFAADQLQRTRTTEVDSYSTLGAFNEVLRQLGLAG